MRQRTAPDHRLRYRHLCDRRRLDFELERLWSTLTHHPEWPSRPASARRALERALDVPLCSPVEDAPRLAADVRAMTARLVLLAKALRALDRREPLPDPVDA